jgi:hypothetical protein
MRNDHTTADNPHYEARLIKVVEVAILDPVLSAHIGHKLKPFLYKLWVFAEGSLEVVRA